MNATQLQVLQYVIENYPNTETLNIVDGMGLSESVVANSLARLKIEGYIKSFVGNRATRWMVKSLGKAELGKLTRDPALIPNPDNELENLLKGR